LTARLSPCKQVAFRQLIKHKKLAAAFDALLDFPGPWIGLEFGNIQRILAMRCDEVRSISSSSWREHLQLSLHQTTKSSRNSLDIFGISYEQWRSLPWIERTYGNSSTPKQSKLCNFEFLESVKLTGILLFKECRLNCCSQKFLTRARGGFWRNLYSASNISFQV
jgi:hypothetical protein